MRLKAIVSVRIEGCDKEEEEEVVITQREIDNLIASKVLCRQLVNSARIVSISCIKEEVIYSEERP